MRIVIAAVTATLTAMIGSVALAQPFPSKPIRFIVPWTPGSATDIWSRSFAARLQDQIGQPVVIDNRGGAGAIIGTEAAAKAPADGYTIYVGGSVSLAISPLIYPKVGYDPIRDFAPISLVSRFFNVVAAHPSLPVKSVKDLITLSKQRPGDLMMASAGNGSTSHIAGELFMSMTGVKWTHVPYKGGGQAITAVLAGESHLAITPVGTTAQHGRAGKLRLLAVTSPTRLAALPDLPTVAEAGVPGFEYGGWNGILVPAGVPAEIISRLHAATVKAANTPEFRAMLQQDGSVLVASTPEQFGAFIRSEFERHQRLVRGANITAQP
jgi:tripartite-type tricarboxylate transporter receptor subunit TctC